MKILITGVAGFLGSHLADRLLAGGHEITGVDSLIGGERANVPDGVDFFREDCSDAQTMRLLCRDSEVVVHCAALAYEGLSVFSPALVSQNVFGGAAGVFSGAIASGTVKRIVHCSSMARYGTGEPPFEEKDECKPVDPYGIAKLASERLLENLCEVHGLTWAVAVPHNIIGPRQKYDDPYRNVASIMANLMLQDRQPVIYGDGLQERCFSFVDECVDCLEKLVLSNLTREIINIGPGGHLKLTIHDVANILSCILDWPADKLDPVYMPGRPQEVKYAFCSSDKAKRLLGYNEKTFPEVGFRSIVEHIRKRGPKPFDYHLPLEIESRLAPRTWKERLF